MCYAVMNVYKHSSVSVMRLINNHPIIQYYKLVPRHPFLTKLCSIGELNFEIYQKLLKL